MGVRTTTNEMPYGWLQRNVRSMLWLNRRNPALIGHEPCGLSVEQLGQLFPFHARLTADGRVLGHGGSLPRLSEVTTDTILSLLRLSSPEELSLAQILIDPELAHGRPLLLESQGGLELSGELLCLENGDRLLVLSPRVETLADLNAAGLTTQDLALHDGLRCRLFTGSMEAGLQELMAVLREEREQG
jgi:hypothetical protein